LKASAPRSDSVARRAAHPGHTRLASVFRTVHRHLRPRSRPPVIEARFFPSVAANHTATLDQGRLQVRVSDLFEDAPRSILEALAFMLLCQIYGRKVEPRFREIYRQYTLSPAMVVRCREARRRRARPRRLPGPQGRAYNLEALFSVLNREYFGGLLRKPTLSWSEGASQSVLGHYEFDENTIVVSRLLDSGRVPLHVVRYVLFHEMLHMKHGARIEGSREIVHPPEFRREERTFREYREANRWLDAH
jgi:hypothetical protein